jgi:hypothetical protein
MPFTVSVVGVGAGEGDIFQPLQPTATSDTNQAILRMSFMDQSEPNEEGVWTNSVRAKLRED